MSEAVTLDVPDDLTRQVRALATATRLDNSCGEYPVGIIGPRGTSSVGLSDESDHAQVRGRLSK